MHTHPRTIVLCFFALLTSTSVAQLGPSPTEIPVRTGAPIVQDQIVDSESARVRPAIDEMLMARAREGTDPVSPNVDVIPSEGSLRNELRASEPTLGSGSSPSTIEGADTTLTGTSSLPSMSDGWGQTIIALGGVILLIFGVAQVFKRLARTQGGLAGQLGAGGTAPSGILEVIGRYPITTGLTLVVLKFDRRVLLVASSAATRGKHAKGASMQTLCELSDPEDVASILLKSRSASGESIAQSFERALRDADDFTDDSIYRYEQPIENAPRPRATRASAPRTITSDEGDRAELWSGGNDGQAAARVLRERLANMRPGTRSA
jgi:flagellar biogenesis protein FliO